MDSLDLRVTWGPKETEVNLVHLVLEVKTALRVQRGVVVLMEKMAHLDQQVKRENLVFQDCPDTQEDKVQRVPSVSQDFLERTARKAQEEPLANQVQGGNEVQRVHVVKEVQGVQQESQAPRVTLEGMAQLVLLVKGDHPDLKDPLDFLDRRAPLVQQGKMDFLATLDREVKLASKEKLAPQVPLVLSARRVQLERPVPWAKEVILGLLDLLVSKVCLV